MRKTAHYDAAAMDAANENTPMFFCEDYEYCTITFVSASSANATVKVYGSAQQARPDLGSAVSASNQYATIGFSNGDTPGTVVDGDTGVARAGTDATVIIKVDCSALRRLGVEMTARAAGNVTAYFDFFTKE